MNYFSNFVVSFGIMLVIMSAATAWLFKSSSAGLVWKLALPAALVALACYTPFAVNGLLGLPVDSTMGALPNEAQLVSFHVIDDEKRVDLWLLSGEVPRAYQTPLDAKMKRVLKQAMAEMRAGRPAYIRRKGMKGDGSEGNGKPGDGIKGNGKPGDGIKGNGKRTSASLTDYNRDDQVEYELVPGAALLPAKD